MLIFETGDDFMKDYRVWITEVLLPFPLDMRMDPKTKKKRLRVKEIIIRTNKTKEGIERHYNSGGFKVLSVAEYIGDKSQELQII